MNDHAGFQSDPEIRQDVSQSSEQKILMSSSVADPDPFHFGLLDPDPFHEMGRK